MPRSSLTVVGIVTAGVAGCWVFAQGQDPDFAAPPPPPMAEVIPAPESALAATGIEYDPQSPDELMVLRVVPDSPADAAGLKPGDVIVSVDNRSFAHADDLQQYLASASTRPAFVRVRRGGTDQMLTFRAEPTIVTAAVDSAVSPVPQPRFGQAGGIGIRIAGSNPVRVVGVFGGSPADVAGILPGDQLLEVNGVPYQTVPEVTAAMAQHGVGENVPVTLSRNGVEQQIVVAPAAWGLSFDGTERVLAGWDGRSRRLGCYAYDGDFVLDDEGLDGVDAAEVAAELSQLRAEVRALRQELREFETAQSAARSVRH